MIVISIDSSIYQVFRIVVIFVSIFSSLVYAYLSAFGSRPNSSEVEYLLLAFESVMLIDILVNFILEFQPDDSLQKVRDIAVIAKRYIRGHFLVDLLAMIQFN